MLKIAVITGTRAEYGLLRPLLLRLDQHDAITLQLVVTGTHFSKEHGHTVDEIISDGFSNFTAIDIKQGPSVKDTARSMATCLTSMLDAFSTLQPDIIILLGDRFEIFATAQAAMLATIPIVHIHGGEITEGAIDDAMRHGITKMAHVHFTSAEPYRQRVIQMGENPALVFNTGSLGHENMLNAPFLSKRDLEENLDFRFRTHNILVTHHPVTSITGHEDEIDHLLEALGQFDDNIGIILTAANADPGGVEIIHKKREFASTRPNCCYVPNLGMTRYVSLMRYIDGVVGNSSGGVIEAPSLGKWTLNIGPRQNGRIKAKSVVDCAATDDLPALLNGLISKSHSAAGIGVSSLFGDGTASSTMTEILLGLSGISLGPKSFYDRTDCQLIGVEEEGI